MDILCVVATDKDSVPDAADVSGNQIEPKCIYKKCYHSFSELNCQHSQCYYACITVAGLSIKQDHKP